MTTIVDAMVVTLGLDARGFKKGKADAEKSIKDTQSTVMKAGAAMETSLRRVVTEFIGLFVAVRSVTDVIHFFENLNASTRQLGIDSKNLGMAANELRNWQNVAEQAGGNAADVTKTIAGLQTALFNLKYKGDMSEQLMMLQRLGVQFQTTTGKLMPFKDVMLQLASIMEKSGRPREENYQWLKAAGLDEGSINAVLSGTAGLREYIAQAERIRQVTPAQTQAAERMARAWDYMKERLTQSATEILEHAEPSIERLFQAMSKGIDWIDAHQDDINLWFTKILEFVTGTGGSSMMEFFRALAYDIETVAAAIHAIVDAIVALNTAGENIGGALYKALHEKAAVDKAGNRAAIGGPVNAGQYAPALAAAEQKYSLPTGLLARVAKQESGFNPQAISSAGARGIMQLMPQYFPGAGQDPSKDIDMAGKYLSEQIKRFGSVEAGLAAYNVGPNFYAHYAAGDINPKTGKKYALPKETQQYPQAVLGPAPIANPLYPSAPAPPAPPAAARAQPAIPARALAPISLSEDWEGTPLAPNPAALDAARGAQPTPALVPSGPPISSTTTGPTSNNVQIDGITIHTQARDADRIAEDIDRSLRRKLLVASPATGLA